MDRNVKYWIWLQCCLGTDSKRLKAAIKRFIEPENIYRASENELRSSSVFSERELSRLVKKDLDYSEKTVEGCDRSGIDIIGYNSPDYPFRLAQISTPPVVLYVKGRLPSQKLLHAAVVGTRNPDKAGKSLAYSFGHDLAERSAVVVSGGAYGVDIFAHKGCLRPGGSTICVLGCGIDMFKSSISGYLLSEVPKNGAIVSEYPPKYPPTTYTFPARNRIISGMSDCLTTVQAGLGSGAIIAVKLALSQKRKVFAVPGDMDYLFASGTNYMLRCGFSAALCADDILSWIFRRELGEGDTFLNPELTEEQLAFMSTKPEQFKLRSSDDLEMPCSPCYELGRAIARQDKTAGTISTGFDQQSFYDDMSYKADADPEPAGETDQPAAAEETGAGAEEDAQEQPFDVTESTVDGLLEEEAGINRRPMFTMEKNTFLALFSSQTDINELTERMNLLTDKKTYPDRKKMKKNSSPPIEKNTASDIVQNRQQNDKFISNNTKNDEMDNKISTEQLTSAAVSVYDTISDTPIFTDAIKAATGLSAGEVLASLTELELFGFIERLPGNRFVRK